MALLRADNVNVAFGGVKALMDVSLEAEAGSITGLIGPNGAGKTTLFNVLSGLQGPASGRVYFEDDDISEVPAFQRGRLGMARTFQRLEVFGSLTVGENVLVAAEIRAGWSRGPDLREQVRGIVERVGLSDVIDHRVDAIPTGQARLVELARAIATEPKLVLLDEPSSGLDESETLGFGDLLLELAADGLAVLLVEHDVELVMRVCDLIHVLEFGEIIASGTPKQIRKDPKVQAAYLGAEV